MTIGATIPASARTAAAVLLPTSKPLFVESLECLVHWEADYIVTFGAEPTPAFGACRDRRGEGDVKIKLWNRAGSGPVT